MNGWICLPVRLYHQSCCCYNISGSTAATVNDVSAALGAFLKDVHTTTSFTCSLYFILFSLFFFLFFFTFFETYPTLPLTAHFTLPLISSLLSLLLLLLIFLPCLMGRCATFYPFAFFSFSHLFHLYFHFFLCHLSLSLLST